MSDLNNITETETQQYNVAIMIFDAVEVLDFAGPYEVFNVTADMNTPAPFNVYTIAAEDFPIETRGRLTVTPDWNLESCPPPDILLIPGGSGSRQVMEDETIITWIQEHAEKVKLLLSVCTGALVLGKAGLLDDLDVTTHQDNLDDLRQIAPKATVHAKRRYIDNGKIITSEGVTAGIDMSLYVVQKLLGRDVLKKTLHEMQYDWQPITNPLSSKQQAAKVAQEG